MGSLTIDDIDVYLISLARAKGRRADMERRLQDTGLSYTVFDAVDGRDQFEALAHEYDADGYAKNMGQNLLPGKVGCYQSHLSVWRRLVAGSSKAALIIEDDIVFHDNFRDALSAGLDICDHWDVLRFNAVRAKLPVCQGNVGPYQLNAYVGPFTGNGTYLIKSDVAERLLPNLLPQVRALDHELNRFFVYDYRQRGLEPFASHPDDGGESQITGTQFTAVRKLPKWKRLPYYRGKAMNYFRRAWYLFRTGALPGSQRDLKAPN